MNQAVRFTQDAKRVECRYDYLNRRVEKTVYEGEMLVSRKRFIYCGFLQLAELDAANATETVQPVLRKTYLWDPMESTATRILAITTFDETGTYVENLFYTHDLLKNTTGLFDTQENAAPCMNTAHTAMFSGWKAIWRRIIPSVSPVNMRMMN